jgi:hypothetical protein
MAVTEEELARARELVEHEPNYSPFNHDLYRLDLDKVYSLMARHARQEREAERERWVGAVTKLLDYIEDHDWGLIPEPHDSIKDLYALLPESADRIERGEP